MTNETQTQKSKAGKLKCKRCGSTIRIGKTMFGYPTYLCNNENIYLPEELVDGVN